MSKIINTIVKHTNKIMSLLDNIIFLDIKTSGHDPFKSEILEIGAIKIKDEKVSIFNTLIKNKREIPLEIYSLYSDLCENDFLKALELDYVSKEFKEFIEDKVIICHDVNFQKKFLDVYIPKINNKFIDSMELAMILEPYHKEYSLDYLKNKIINNHLNEKNRALSDSMNTLNIVNSLLIRNYKREKNQITLEPLTFKINSYLNKFGFSKWNWTKYLDEANYELKLDIDIRDEDCNSSKDTNNLNKEKDILKRIILKDKSYEELLKDEDIWTSKEGFIYEYRPGQYELTKTIRETFMGKQCNIACIEAPTGIGKSVGYLLPAVLEARMYNKRIIISTDTKELQIQLINKDIPNVLNSLGLNNKVSYGYIKGKNNYICVEKLEAYKSDYSPQNPKLEDIISIIYLERLVDDGKYGDIEEINYYVTNYFKNLDNHLRKVSCDPNLCRPKKCYKNCLYKKRIEELKEEDITVINHSLLAKWPYKEEKPLENIIVDEAHNLTEKGYEFFSSIVDSKVLKYFLQEIYPYENISNSPFLYNPKLRKIKVIDKFYSHIRLDKSLKDKISKNINFILEEINSILFFGQQSDYKGISKYNLKWELNLQQNEIAGQIYKNKEYSKILYDKYTEKIKLSCESMIRNLTSILIIIDKHIDDDSVDKESDVYKFGKSRFKDIEDIKNTLQIFMEYSFDDDFARIVEIDKLFTYFEFRVVPLKLADLFEENILNQINSGIFLSATLSVGNNMNYFKRTLGINKVENIEKIIQPIYDYKNRVEVINISDICSYKNNDFAKEMSYIISKIANVTQGHILSLFTSKDRQEKTYDILKEYLHNIDTQIYMNKKGIKFLKDMDKKCVVLGSKGCFEGVDIPGDGLVCVTLDKIPNLNPKDPLYFAIMKKYNMDYYQINYPQMAIKIKQAMGRILRSKYDYGCFIVFNTSKNINTLKRLEKDLHGCKMLSIKKENLCDYIKNHLNRCREKVIKSAIIDIAKPLKNYDYIDVNKLEEYFNIEIKNRSIKSKVSYIGGKEKKLKIKYFDLNYLIQKDKLI
ncbi:exonuclease [Romboutsia maritimum]|uniref:Exonuclease n=1 Tax=Romboutsia maritimum TaxID=2020948 RepID=A0A371IW04_9FIRM|nr:helicase C-terminal domain-containing protein [Romboutsia maritimum]RDY24661.1 exonuclease [Romboutsia maritimum]